MADSDENLHRNATTFQSSQISQKMDSSIHLSTKMPENVEFTSEASGRNRIPIRGVAENRAIFQRKF